MPKKEDEPVIKRVPSGIHGLDELIGGGFIPGNTYLITGDTGTGKTLFCCQFLWEGLNMGEPGIYFTLEETPQDIMEDVKEFGWDFKKYIRDKKFSIEFQDPFELIDISSEIKSRIEKFGAKRVVIDSTSVFGMIFKNEHDLRKNMYELIKMLRGTGAVVLMTAEISDSEKGLSRFGVEEFIVDGIIVLKHFGIAGESSRKLMIWKMRRTDHGKEVYPMEITKNGIVVKK